MPWEISQNYIRSGHRSVDEFEPESLRTVVVSGAEGIKAIIGKVKGKNATEIVSYLFDVSKGWTLEKAKEWFKQHYRGEAPSKKEHFLAVLPFKVLEKIVDKPLHIRGVALTAGISRNLNVYLPEELEAFAERLVSAPVYIEHVAVPNAVGKEITVNYYPNIPAKECSLVKEMRIENGTIANYKALSIFHYRSSHLPPPRKIFTLKRKDELCGVIVYSYPPLTMFGRSKVWKGNPKQLQKEISTITRVIIHPKYRTIGLGAKIVRETLPLAGTQYVETLAVMAKYNPFFEKAGMHKIAESQPNPHLLKAIEKLNKLGFEPHMLQSQKHNMEKIKKVDKRKIINIVLELSRKSAVPRKRILPASQAYPSREEFADKVKRLNCEGLAKVLKRLSFMTQTKVYLFWASEGSDVRPSPHSIYV